jgi:hypothetical protein
LRLKARIGHKRQARFRRIAAKPAAPAPLTAFQPSHRSFVPEIRQKGPPMTQQMFALSLGLAGMLAAAQVAHGAPQCDTRDRVLSLLAETYGETRRSVGIAGQAAVMELYAADATGTWTITITLPDGQMCLMASGSGYETVTDGLPAKGNPA